MIDGQLEVDEAKVSNTVAQPQAAGGALLTLLTCAHLIVQDSEGDGSPLRILVVKVLLNNFNMSGTFNLLRGLHPKTNVGDFVGHITFSIQIFPHFHPLKMYFNSSNLWLVFELSLGRHEN